MLLLVLESLQFWSVPELLCRYQHISHVYWNLDCATETIRLVA